MDGRVMLTSIHAWQSLLDERRTVDGVVKSWSVDPTTRKPKVIERPALGHWSYAAWRERDAWGREVESPLRGLRAILSLHAERA
jgi:hypothetical protein